MTEEEKLFDHIKSFLNDFIDLLQTIQMTSTENLFIIKIDETTSFALPATFQSFSRRSTSLQNELQRFIRSKAQRRREEISKGIENDFSTRFRRIHWQNDLKKRLIELQKVPFERFVCFLRAMINALDFYVEILDEKSSSNKTFRILSIFDNIRKQFCNISKTIQRLIEINEKSIDTHLQQIETNLKLYENEMKEKLRDFIYRDVRPAVLVVPCPMPMSSDELIKQIKTVKSTDSL